MSYHVECEVCRHQVEVSDPSAKIDQCPECGSYYTMMPVTVRPRATVASLLRYSDPDLLVPPPAPAPAACGLTSAGTAVKAVQPPAGPLSHEASVGEKPSAPVPLLHSQDRRERLTAA